MGEGESLGKRYGGRKEEEEEEEVWVWWKEKY